MRFYSPHFLNVIVEIELIFLIPMSNIIKKVLHVFLKTSKSKFINDLFIDCNGNAMKSGKFQSYSMLAAAKDFIIFWYCKTVVPFFGLYKL
ncbi:MAG: hypothetical protein EBR35_05215 [Flavobacteriales bacterium]|nr:hypothetical protein [Crocinitomicaceae bacterium]NBW30643.1 hypothetical protein [Flavobacteriales bacterium]NDA98258.1 hypothetical protein [Flavobacteriia bacterium]NDC28190.1 hypothetical protein [Crocinitomicaceae bacterium]NDC93194.1 hypothetical protein [Flavobacteriales bacterium]